MDDDAIVAPAHGRAHPHEGHADYRDQWTLARAAGPTVADGQDVTGP